jgi:hypothetical protein
VTCPRRCESERGQAVLEYTVVILVTLLVILGIIQVVLLSNARSVLELAAFNASRAAVVARSDRAPDAVAPSEMRKRAQLAAFVTLLPVLTGFSGAPREEAAQALANLARAHPDDDPGLFLDSLRELGSRQPQNLLREFRALEVSFVRIDAPDPRDPGAREGNVGDVRFDDPDSSRANLIKVLVTWRYPCVVPFVNRIFGERTGREAPRVPLHATSVMRMQWNRRSEGLG